MSNTLKAIIVDDEELARSDLSAILSDFENIEVIGEANCVSNAKKIIHDLEPDIVFLDIQMPGGSGFELLNDLEIKTNIIFVTAFDEFAINAFEVNAQDYLLKPINPERLAQALEKIKSKKPGITEEKTVLDYDDPLFLSLNNRYEFLKINTILVITAAGDYTEVLNDRHKKFLTQKSMKEWEQRLPSKHFIRIHRSTIVNLNFIDKIEEWFNYSYRIYMKDIEKPFIMSRRYASKLKELLA